MAIVELFVSVLIVGISAVNAALPALAGRRTRELRFLWVVLANVALAAFGGLAAWSELPGVSGAPSPVPLSGLLLALATAALLLVSTVWPRRT